MKLLPTVFAVIASLSIQAFSQVDLSAAVAIPVGKFASSTDGLAQTRFGFSGTYYKPVSPQLSIGGEAAFIMNTFDRSAFAAELLNQGASQASASGGTYLNFPLLAVVKITPDGLAAHGISLHAGIGVDFMRMTDLEFKVDGENGTFDFDPGAALAWSLGGQITTGQFFFGARYLNLGEHSITGTVKSNSNSNTFSGTQEVAVVNIFAGVRIP